MGEVDSSLNSLSELTSLLWGSIFYQSEMHLSTDYELDESKNGFRTKYRFKICTKSILSDTAWTF